MATPARYYFSIVAGAIPTATGRAITRNGRDGTRPVYHTNDVVRCHPSI